MRGVRRVALAASEHGRKIRISSIDRNTCRGPVGIIAGNCPGHHGILPVLTVDGDVSWKAGKQNNRMDYNRVRSLSKATSDLNLKSRPSVIFKKNYSAFLSGHPFFIRNSSAIGNSSAIRVGPSFGYNPKPEITPSFQI
jgi:hypothetical protein